MGNIKDRASIHYSRLLVLCKIPRRAQKGRVQWLCLCTCGNTATVSGNNLQSGHTKSCGCLNQDLRRARKLTHGMTDSRLYDVYYNMLRRCKDTQGKDYVNYGGRGVEVCEEWQISFENFLGWAVKAGYKRGLEIDREDNDSSYSPDNCRFITSLRNNHNKSGVMRTNKSGYTGVWFNKVTKKFVANIGWSEEGVYKRRTIGRFNTSWEACQSRNDFIKKYNLPHKIQKEEIR